MADIVNKETQKILNEFCKAYSLQKDVDLDEVECVCYQQGKKTVFYFRKKRKELIQYGPEVIQD
jgi:hypothetical protein